MPLPKWWRRSVPVEFSVPFDSANCIYPVVIRRLTKLAPLLLLSVLLYGCHPHRGTPSDPNEQQGNPNAHPEKSIDK